jgi:hypothetical protein
MDVEGDGTVPSRGDLRKIWRILSRALQALFEGII